MDYIKLPALAKDAPRAYRGKFLPIAPNDLIDYRKAVLRDTVEHFDPEVVLVDKAPIGVCGELLPALRWLRRERPDVRVIFGMRDIEDSPEATIEQWNLGGVLDALDECFDQIWVYGVRSIFDVVQEYQLPHAIRGKLTFMGYVARGACDHPPRHETNERSILVTVGGGTDGDFLLENYLSDAADRFALMGYRSIVIGGPDLPHSSAANLRKQAEQIQNVTWLDFEPCMNCRIRAADAVVSMGGYNTLCQIVRNRKPALIIPRTKPRLEQAIRAQIWAERGLVDSIDSESLTPAALTERLVQLLERGPVCQVGELDFSGLDRVCERFGTLWQTETPSAAPLCM